MLSFNEGKVCDAIVRLIEDREGLVRTDTRSPESDHDPDPVEFAWRCGQKLYALEHTGIEPFAEHIRLEREAKYHFQPIIDRLAGELPQEVIELHVPLKIMNGKRRDEVAAIQNALVNWIKVRAPTLPIRTYADYIGDIPEEHIQGVSFPFVLYRFSGMGDLGGKLKIAHVLTGDREKGRMERLDKSCHAKFPKLAAWKEKHGARSILVLEENDIQLTNYALVAEAYNPLALARTDRPDETYLVSTSHAPWMIWPLLIDGKTIHEMSVDGWDPRFPVDPNTLTSITGR